MTIQRDNWQESIIKSTLDQIQRANRGPTNHSQNSKLLLQDLGICSISSKHLQVACKEVGHQDQNQLLPIKASLQLQAIPSDYCKIPTSK